MQLSSLPLGSFWFRIPEPTEFAMIVDEKLYRKIKNPEIRVCVTFYLTTMLVYELSGFGLESVKALKLTTGGYLQLE